MAKFSAYKVHEARMTFKEIVVPAIATAIYGVAVFSDKDTRDATKEWFVEVKNKAKDKIHKVFHK